MGIVSWLKDRLGLGFFLDHLIPSHANSWSYTIGGSIAVLAILEGITGILLQQFYHPMPDQNAAYASVRYITSFPLWNFIRNLHYWGAQLIFLFVILHMMRVYISAAYKKPRELLWVSGVVLLVLSWLLLFTGTVLRWDQEAVEALGHNLELASYVGPLAYWFSPSFAPDVPLLIRVNSAHVTILPMLALSFVVLHIYLIRIQGISSPTNQTATEEKRVPFSTHLVRIGVYGMFAVGLALILSLLTQVPLSSVGNPEIEVSKPDWYMLWIYDIENYFGLESVPYILTLFMVIILLVPALDRKPQTDPRKRRIMMILLLIAIVLFAFLTINAAILPPESHLG